MTFQLLAMLSVLAADAGSAPANEALPPLARALLKKRMEGHGRDHARLARGVLLLEREKVKVIADELAAEPRLVRPLPGSRDELNASLPERFFVFQDALRLRAQELATAATQTDDAQLAAAYGRLVQACVSCHSAFLERE